VAYDIIELSEEEFDSFIEFLNFNEEFLKTASEMELITFIKDKYDHFNITRKMEFVADPEWRKVLTANYKQALTELLNMYVTHNVIDLPLSEFNRFISFMNLDVNLLKKSSDLDVLNVVRSKYDAYISFYKIDVRLLRSNYNITDEDNKDWRWELKHNRDKNAAMVSLLNLYNEHKVIQLNSDEYEKFIIFLSLSESFMQKASNEEMIQFVREKYYKYLDFYKN
jgi:hypothetical protein